MRFLLLLATAVVTFVPVLSSPYRCLRAYDPSSYGNGNLTRLPPQCFPENIVCPVNWKSGIPRGHSQELPLIDINFVQCHEGFFCCGSVPIDRNTGNVLSGRGVTVGSEIDLGLLSDSALETLNVPRKIISQLQLYFGLRGNNAACAAIELPLVMSCSDAQLLTEAVTSAIVDQVHRRYDLKRAAGTEKFGALPRGIRTAIADVWIQFGSSEMFPSLWDSVISNDWEKVILKLRNFYIEPKEVPKRDLQRRNNEADVIESALVQCNRSADVVFLIDESGTVSDNNFRSSLNMARKIIDAFPEEGLKGDEGTRFGLSLFDSNYRSEFHLSSFTNKSAYFKALRSVTQSKGHTRLGRALRQVLLDQFHKTRGLRAESSGLLRVLIVVTDGHSRDEIAEAASEIRENNIVIYGIGIGTYDILQLRAVASSESHVKLFETFSDLGDFTATLTASMCHEPRPVTLGVKIAGSVNGNNFQYYKFSVPGNVNFRVDVMAITGNTLVYASQTNPHPYKYDNDFSFKVSSAAQTNKTLIASPAKKSANSTNSIFISVATTNETATYVLVGTTCDPTECSEGIDGGRGGDIPQGAPAAAVTALILTVVAIMMNY